MRGVDKLHKVTTVAMDAQFEAERKRQADKFQNDMAAIGQNNLDANAAIDAQQRAANTAYEGKQNARQTAYDKELAQLEEDRLNAEQEFNDAVAEAAKARADFEADPKVEWNSKKFNFDALAEDIVDVIEEAIEKAGRTISSSGTFNAAAIQSLQRADHPFHKIEQNTGETAKNTKKLLHQNTPSIIY